jgi:hypothetical protein
LGIEERATREVGGGGTHTIKVLYGSHELTTLHSFEK